MIKKIIITIELLVKDDLSKQVSLIPYKHTLKALIRAKSVYI
jgi:hypothetical protein